MNEAKPSRVVAPDHLLSAQELASSPLLGGLLLMRDEIAPGPRTRRDPGGAIRYGMHDGPFGRVLLAISDQRLCWLGFVLDGDDGRAVAELLRDWPAAALVHDQAGTVEVARRVFALARGELHDPPLPLLLRGTRFELAVWEMLLRIPLGRVTSYRALAQALGRPLATRAVGHAVGANPVSLLVPCHRAVLSNWVAHNYRWGVPLKQQLLAQEARPAVQLVAGEDEGLRHRLQCC